MADETNPSDVAALLARVEQAEAQIEDAADVMAAQSAELTHYRAHCAAARRLIQNAGCYCIWAGGTGIPTRRQYECPRCAWLRTIDGEPWSEERSRLGDATKSTNDPGGA